MTACVRGEERMITAEVRARLSVSNSVIEIVGSRFLVVWLIFPFFSLNLSCPKEHA